MGHDAALHPARRLEGAALLHCALEGLDSAVLADARAAEGAKAGGDSHRDAGPASPVTPLGSELAGMLEGAGIAEPLEKVGLQLSKYTAPVQIEV